LRILKIILTIFTVLNGFVLTAQVTPCFNAVSTRGCAPFTLQLKDCSGGTSKFYEVTSTNGFAYAGFDSTITLPKAGLYNVTQRAGTGNLSGTIPLPKLNYIEVLEAVQPSFDIQICEGRSINLITSTTPYEEYKINWGDGSPTETVNAGITSNHIYTTNASRTVTVTGNYVPGGCGNYRSKTITPFQSLSKPEIKTILAENQKVIISFEAEPQYQYRILEDQGSGFNKINEILYQAGQQTIELNRNTLNNSYTYQIEAFDDCGNFLPSEPVSTFQPTITNGNKQVKIDIPIVQITNTDEINIYRNGQLIQTLPTGSNSFTDPNIECGNKYCYVIEGISNNSISKTEEFCVTGQSTLIPEKINDLNSSFSGSAVKLDWANASFPIKEYKIYTTDFNSTNTTPIETVNSNKYTDLNYNKNTSGCYVVNLTDLCNNTAPLSNLTCPINLQIEKDPFVNLLQWNNYYGSETITEYKILKFDSEMNLIDEFIVSGTNTYSDPVPQEGGTYYYQLTATNAGGFTTKSTIAEAKNEMLVIIPSAFSPNGDMINDIFVVKGKFIKDLKMFIYNNWGELLFTSNSIQEGWDGKDFATNQPSGSYAYIIEATDFEGKTQVKTGTVTLVR